MRGVIVLARVARFGAFALALAVTGCRADAPPLMNEPAIVATPREWIELLVPDASSTSGAAAPAWSAINFGGGGEIELRERGVRLHAGSPMTGIAWRDATNGAPLPTTDYEIEVEAARVAGNDFFCALTFPVGEQFLTLVLGGWGGSTCGLSCLDGLDASSNRTTTYHRFDKGRAYRARVVVTPTRVEAFVDDEPLCSIDLAGLALSLRTEVLLCRPLGIATYATTADLHRVRWRPRAY